MIVNGSEREVSFDAADLRRVLGLQAMEVYDDVVSEKEALEAIRQDMGYDTTKGSRKFQAPCIKGIWKFLMYMVTKCLGCKISSMDQANEMEITVLHSMIRGINLDYATLFFNILKSKIIEETRNSHVLYPRFMCLLLEDKIGSDVYSNLLTPSTESQVVSGNIFRQMADQTTPM